MRVFAYSGCIVDFLALSAPNVSYRVNCFFLDIHFAEDFLRYFRIRYDLFLLLYDRVRVLRVLQFANNIKTGIFNVNVPKTSKIIIITQKKKNII